jgi:hypothetical protein
MEVVVKVTIEENQIMMADLSIMDPVQKTWFEKKQMII